MDFMAYSSEKEYMCSPNTKSKGFTKLMMLVMMTGEFPSLNSEIRKMITNDPKSINDVNEEGWTALMLACRNSKTNSTERTVEILIELGANINIQEKDGWTALMLAVTYSNKNSTDRTVDMLLKAGADLNIQNKNGNTALILAVDHYNNESTKETFKTLMKAGANINIKNNREMTALMLAFEDGKQEVVEIFIETKVKSEMEKKYEKKYRMLKEIAQKHQCCICFGYTNKKKVCVPCGHKQYCNECIMEIKECSLCQKNIDSIITLY